MACSELLCILFSSTLALLTSTVKGKMHLPCMVGSLVLWPAPCKGVITGS